MRRSKDRHRADTPAGLCFTPGTTGAPKGVTYTHRSNYLHTVHQLQADASGLTARDSVLVAVPMFHANGWGFPFSGPAVGAKLVLPGRHQDGASLANIINAEGVTVAAGVLTVWLGLADHLDRTGEEVPSLQRIMLGGSSVPQPERSTRCACGPSMVEAEGSRSNDQPAA